MIIRIEQSILEIDETGPDRTRDGWEPEQSKLSGAISWRNSIDSGIV